MAAKRQQEEKESCKSQRLFTT
jgi:hypothetical protein